jgi:hypothetical protein
MAEASSMKCPKCRFDNREGIKFCEACGTKLELNCPACGAEIPFGRKFCGQCGHKFANFKKTPSIDYTQPQSYTPDFLVDKIISSRGSLEGERKQITVLLADIKDSTERRASIQRAKPSWFLEGFIFSK